MNIEARIINANTCRAIHKIDVADGCPGLTPTLVRLAESEVREWAKQHSMRVITDTFSQGAYRAWVDAA